MTDLSPTTTSTSGSYPEIFSVFGFNVRVGVDGRRMWPGDFKEYICTELNTGGLTLAEVLETCQLDPSTLREWRGRWGKKAPGGRVERLSRSAQVSFSEVKIHDSRPETTPQILLKAGRCELHLPRDYPPAELGLLIQTIEHSQ